MFSRRPSHRLNRGRSTMGGGADFVLSDTTVTEGDNVDLALTGPAIDGATSAVLYLDGVSQGSQTSPWHWSLLDISPGSRAITIDVTGGSLPGVHGPATLTVSAQAPVCTSPADASTLTIGASATLTATVYSVANTTKIEWYLDGVTLIGTDLASAYTQPWTVAGTAGAHTIIARRYTAAGTVDSAARNVTLNDTPALTLEFQTFLASGTLTHPGTVYDIDYTTANQADGYCIGGGGAGQIATGGAGGGAFAGGPFTFSGNRTVTVGAGGSAGADGGDSSIDAVIIAKGGQSRVNGGAGGTAAGSTGTTKYDGGAGTAGAGTVAGGGGAGDAGAGVASARGPNLGGLGGITTPANQFGAGGRSTAAAGDPGAAGLVGARYFRDATAGYARIIGRTWGSDTANGTTRNVTLPALPPGWTGSNGILVMIPAFDGAPTISATGWTALTQQNDGASAMCLGALWRAADGSDPVALATSASEAGAWQIFRIVAPDGGVPGTPTWTTDAAQAVNANPPSHAPAGGSAKYLWLACVGFESSATGIGLTGIPASYNNHLLVPAATATAAHVAVATRLTEAASEDPGAFTNSSVRACRGTLSIGPS